MEVLAELFKKIWKQQKEFTEYIDPNNTEEQKFLDGALWGINVLIYNWNKKLEKEKETNKKE